ncbi:YfhD family protein [Paenibacillus thalictri]|uniref:YfhD family protein n=1 Tax=Paenibacillus thalictri TaxID=2527873 RepID=A0A4Q9DFX6_9BACL|nr:YfhD family protein [Paenibacillus thalictri]TBL70420.1 YfhD family protein [Paenibacillus thalictri]
MVKHNNKGNSLPIAKNEDVEFSADQADAADLKAAERADEADARQEGK